jgi:GNAT superfamily N-acetyltransferase
MSGHGDVAATEAAEMAAFRDVFAAVPSDLAALHGIEVVELAGVTLTAVRDIPANSMLDRAVGLGIEAPAEEETLDAICAWFESRGVDLYVSIAPGAQPPELAGWLERRGFEEAWSWMKFSRGTEPLENSGGRLRVERARPGEAPTYGRIVATAFGMPEWVGEWLAALHNRPGWTLHIAWDGAAPVGAAGLYVAGEAGYFSFGSVLPEHRGKGAQRALFAARIEEAARLGCTVLVTETGARVPGKPDFSYTNILRAGFEEQYVRPNYVRRAARA